MQDILFIISMVLLEAFPLADLFIYKKMLYVVILLGDALFQHGGRE